MTPVVSIIVPCYRSGLFIEETVRSVQKQTFRDWECLLVDDGSDDERTNKALERISAWGDARVRILSHPCHANRGVAASRNLGLDQSLGKYIAFLDGDDAWMAKKLELQVAVLDAAADHVGLVFSDFWECHDPDPARPMEEQQLVANTWGITLSQWFDGTRRETFRKMVEEPPGKLFNWVQSPTPLVRRACFSGGLRFAGPPALTVQFEDYLMWLLIAARWDFIALPERLSIYRVHSESFTGTFHDDPHAGIRRFEGLCQLVRLFAKADVPQPAARALRNKLTTYAFSRLPYTQSAAHRMMLFRYHMRYGGMLSFLRHYRGILRSGGFKSGRV